MTLTLGDFPAFFTAVNRGYLPFPWQMRFLEEVWARRQDSASAGRYFPELVDLPTGSGKTSIIDIAVFLLALEAARPLEQRRIPRRIVFVVDRRVVVDQAHEHAQYVAQALRNTTSDPVVRQVAESLGSYAPGAHLAASHGPLQVAALRGGVVRDESWARRPDMPAVLSATVDQVGSRLLFRGYGLSASMQPVHAGLLGTDTLFILDEVHLSVPFAETLRALASDFQASWAERDLPRRWEVIELSATPGRASERTFSLSDEHGDFDRAINETLPRRIEAAKPVVLKAPVKVVGSDRGRTTDTFAAECVACVDGLLERENVTTVAVVVNRVEAAAAVYGLAVEQGVDAVLLTGRMRPHERDRVMIERIGTRLAMGRVRDPGEPFVVVSTQCIEAGADFDFDAMVSEAASLDALIQRFGRVDRDGRLSEAGTPAAGVLLVKASDLKDGSDPIYGKALASTWNALASLDGVDFGITRLGEQLRNDPELRVPPVHAPVLFPGHLDAWVQTNPKPSPDPDPKFWLHGPDSGAADVSVVWRSDLTEDLLERALAETEGAGLGESTLAVRTLVVAAPPGALEAMSVPIAIVRRWLTGLEVPPVSDVESDPFAVDPGAPRRAARPSRPFVRWAGDHSVVLQTGGGRRAGRPSDLRPGDVILVPSEYGGIGEHGSWQPGATDPVPDLAERTQLIQRNRAVLRLLPGVLRNATGAMLDVALPDLDAEPDRADRDHLEMWLEDHVAELHTDQRVAATEVLRALANRDLRRRVTVGRVVLTGQDGLAAPYLIATGPVTRPVEQLLARSSPASMIGDTSDSVDSEPETSSFTAVPVPLDEHLVGVGDWARMLATNCGLHEGLIGDLELAGRLHDLGKADPRFQAWITGGDPLAVGGGPLAKSALPADAYAIRQAARARSGYPPGARHELLSLAMIDGVDALEAKADDWDLVRHLVASHHGWCRPFPPAVPDGAGLVVGHEVDGIALAAESRHRLERLDSGVADRFWLLVRRYGWHRLAWLEAILRLADHRRSEWEQRTHPSDGGASNRHLVGAGETGGQPA